MRRLAVALAAALFAAPVVAQQLGSGSAPAAGVPASAVVVLDRDALFTQSLFGKRIASDIEAASVDLATENRQIEADLEAEELELTTLRDTMDPDEFRGVAADFDEKVNGIRQAQDAKSRAITQQTERAQQIFLEQANPVLVRLAQETGALVILDRRIVIASADQVDITDIALARIDEVLGDGGALFQTPPVPRPQTPPTTDN